MAKDADYKRLIHAGKWLTLRKAVLTAHPLCASCEAKGETKLATEVHHAVPVETAHSYAEKESLMYDVHNLVPLCHLCHVEAHMAMRKGTREERMKRTKEETKHALGKLFGEGG